MPRFDIRSSKERKLDLAQKQQDLDLGQQNADQRQQALMLDQLRQLYGLQQDQQMDPQRLRAATLANEGAAFGLEQDQAFVPRERQQRLDAGDVNLDIGRSNAAWAEPNARQAFDINALNLNRGQTELNFLPTKQEQEVRGNEAAIAKALTEEAIARAGIPYIPQREDAEIQQIKANTRGTNAQMLAVVDPNGALYGANMRDATVTGRDPAQVLQQDRTQQAAEAEFNALRTLLGMQADDPNYEAVFRSVMRYLKPEQIRTLGARVPLRARPDTARNLGVADALPY